MALRCNPAFVRLQLRSVGGGRRPDELGKNERHRGKRHDERRIDQDWKICSGHVLLTRSILSLISVLGRFLLLGVSYFSKSSSPARLVAFTTALMSVTRSFPSSSSRIPSMVQPAGVVTASFSSAG